jgi:hypothetical protein
VGRPRKVHSEIPKIVTRAQACQFLGIGQQKLRDMVAAKIAVEGPTLGDIMLQETTQRYLEDLRAKAAGRASTEGSSLATVRVEREKIEADIARLNLATKRGEVLTLGEVLESWGTFASLVKAKFLGLPVKIGGVIPHLTAHDRVTIKTIIRDELRDLAEEVRSAVIAGDEKAFLDSDGTDGRSKPVRKPRKKPDAA